MTDRTFFPLLLTLTAVLAGVVGTTFVPPPPVPIAQPERARFMLECVQDYQYTPETCAAIWSGDDPPQRADGVDIPGC